MKINSTNRFVQAGKLKIICIAVLCPIKIKRKILGAIAGANLLWAEVGANPRDVQDKTEEGRGETVSRCRTIFH